MKLIGLLIYYLQSEELITHNEQITTDKYVRIKIKIQELY